jgi:hypothetical protein
VATESQSTAEPPVRLAVGLAVDVATAAEVPLGAAPAAVPPRLAG